MTFYLTPSMRNEAHDLFFSENYETIQRWALQITRHDRDIAQDLIHDLYIKFVQRARSSEVGSEDGYLYVALKNQHISYLRQEAKKAASQLSLSDADFNEDDLITFDPRSATKIADELRTVCEFACSRKETSISASILILRFFHGYYSAEVARIVNRPINAVEVFLRTARRETRRYLAYSRREDEARSRPAPSTANAETGGGLLKELRAEIFGSVQHRCLPRQFFKNFYAKSDRKMDRELLSHLVSCRKCLDTVNGLLGIPSLKERHPLDTVRSEVNRSSTRLGKAKAAFSVIGLYWVGQFGGIDWTPYGNINFL